MAPVPTSAFLYQGRQIHSSLCVSVTILPTLPDKPTARSGSHPASSKTRLRYSRYIRNWPDVGWTSQARIILGSVVMVGHLQRRPPGPAGPAVWHSSSWMPRHPSTGLPKSLHCPGLSQSRQQRTLRPSSSSLMPPVPTSTCALQHQLALASPCASSPWQPCPYPCLHPA